MSNRVIHMAGPDVGPLEASIVADAVANGWYAPEAYKYVEMFESEFANWHGRRFGLMTPNCTSAIHLVLEGLGICEGDEVIAPESTWIGSTAGITHSGAETVFADIESLNWCVSRDTVLARVTPRTRAVIAVDLYGNMPRWDELEAFSRETGIPVIEDAAEALGSRFQHRKAGNFGIASVFSFHRTKTLTTGEGGMLLLDDEDLYQRCAFLRDHGRASGTYFNTEIAFKYMPSNLTAALGHGQFLRIEELLENKRHTFLRFRENFRHLPELQLNEESLNVHNGAWATEVVFDEKLGLKRDQIVEELGKRGIPVRPFFYPLSSLPAYAANRTGGPKANPIAYHCSEFGIHLPCSMNLTDDIIDYISDEVETLVETAIANA